MADEDKGKKEDEGKKEEEDEGFGDLMDLFTDESETVNEELALLVGMVDEVAIDDLCDQAEEIRTIMARWAA
jgi:hypothetical protein